jgi:glutathione S-transferase
MDGPECMPSPMRLYDYGPSPNCYKVRLLLAQLGAEYERVPVDIFGGDTLTDEYGAINPSRRVPVLETAPGEYLPESGAILLQLAEGTPFLPDDPYQRGQVVRWLFFEQSAVVPSIGGLRFLVGTGRIDAESAPKGPSVQALRVLEGHLTERDFLVGDGYSLADLALFGYVHAADEGGIEMDRFPAVLRWLDRVREQPGYMNDLEGFPENARPGESRSIYDPLR